MCKFICNSATASTERKEVERAVFLPGPLFAQVCRQIWPLDPIAEGATNSFLWRKDSKDQKEAGHYNIASCRSGTG